MTLDRKLAPPNTESIDIFRQWLAVGSQWRYSDPVGLSARRTSIGRGATISG